MTYLNIKQNTHVHYQPSRLEEMFFTQRIIDIISARATAHLKKIDCKHRTFKVTDESIVRFMNDVNRLYNDTQSSLYAKLAEMVNITTELIVYEVHNEYNYDRDFNIWSTLYDSNDDYKLSRLSGGPMFGINQTKPDAFATTGIMF